MESLEPASPVGGRNLMKASHSHSSPLRLHFVHMGRMSSPEMLSDLNKEGQSITSEASDTYISCVFGGNSGIRTAFVDVSDLSTRRLHQTCYTGLKNDGCERRASCTKYDTVELLSMTVMADRREMDCWRRWLLHARGKCSRSQPHVSWHSLKLCYGA